MVAALRVCEGTNGLRKCVSNTQSIQTTAHFKSILFTQIIFDVSNACHSYAKGSSTLRRLLLEMRPARAKIRLWLDQGWCLCARITAPHTKIDGRV